MTKLEIDSDIITVLTEAKSYLQRYGWRQGSMMSSLGSPSCLVGALRWACSSFVGQPHLMGNGLTEDAKALFTRTIQRLGAQVGYYFGNALIRWNNLPGRTKEEVYHLIDATIKALQRDDAQS